MQRRTFVTAVTAVTMGGIAGCGAPTGEGEQAETTTTEGGGQAEATTTEGGGPATVEMITEGSDYYFDPIGLFVEPGDTVEWVNAAGVHSSTAYAEGNGPAEVRRIPEGADPWNSETITEEGGTFSYTFEETGTYDYFCIPHKALEMVGRVVCGEPGGPAEGSMPPDGDVPESQAIVDAGSISYDEFTG